MKILLRQRTNLARPFVSAMPILQSIAQRFDVRIVPACAAIAAASGCATAPFGPRCPHLPHRPRCRASRSRRRRRSTVRLSAAVSARLCRRLRERFGSGAQRRRALCRRSELSHRLAGRRRTLPQEIATARPPTSHFVDVRGERHHVQTWGEPQSTRSSCCMAGWTSAHRFSSWSTRSRGDWYVIAPDLRGFGRSAWQPQGYWFYDYFADLEAFLARFVPDARRASSGTALAATSRWVTPACGLAGCTASSRSRASAFRPSRASSAAQGREVARRDAIRRFDCTEVSVRSPTAAVEKSAPAARQGGAFSPPTGPPRSPMDARELVSDPATQAAVSHVYRMDEIFAIWRNITAPVLWVAAEDSRFRAGSRAIRKARPVPTGSTKCAGASRTSPARRSARFPDAGHMLHHDQPHRLRS